MTGATRHPDAGPRFLALDDDVLLFSEGRQEVIALNATAAAIWMRLIDKTGIEQIVGDLVAEGLDESQARRGVQTIAEHHRRFGDAPAPPRRRLDPARRRRSASFAPDPARPDRAQRTYRLLRDQFTLHFADINDERRIHPFLRHLEAKSETPPLGRHFHTAVFTSGGDHIVATDGIFEDRCAERFDLAPLVHRHLQVLAVRSTPYVIDIHAAALAIGGRCLLLPGASGQGKSTLALALTTLGMELLSDEVAPIDSRSLGVWPIPLCASVKVGSDEALAPYFPELQKLARHTRWDDKVVHLVVPPRPEGAARLDRPIKVGWIIFPDYAPGAAGALTPVSRATALQRLFTESSSLPGRLSSPRVEAMARWIGRLDCFDLRYGKLNQALGLIEEMTARNRDGWGSSR